MPKGHRFTRCQNCGSAFMCTDCIPALCPQCKRKESQERAVECLTEMVNHSNAVKMLTNTELADALLDLWEKTEIGTRKEALLAETIDRLRVLPNVQNPPE